TGAVAVYPGVDPGRTSRVERPFAIDGPFCGRRGARGEAGTFHSGRNYAPAEPHSRSGSGRRHDRPFRCRLAFIEYIACNRRAESPRHRNSAGSGIVEGRTGGASNGKNDGVRTAGDPACARTITATRTRTKAAFQTRIVVAAQTRT